MTAAIGRPLTAFLRRSVILAGILALIAGIFGMHMLSGAHGLHATATSPTAVTQLDGYPAAVGETAPRQLTAVGAEPAASFSEASSSCSDPVTCPTMSTTAQECIPAPANTSLEAPVPGAALPAPRLDTSGGPRLCHAPLTSSPSPMTLGISRT